RTSTNPTRRDPGATILEAPLQRPAHGRAPSRALAREEMMKAIVQSRYGSPDLLRLVEVDKPVVKDDQVLVRVRAAAVNIGDWHLLRGVPYVLRLVSGPRKPKREIPGMDIAGQVEAVGGN